MRVTKYAWQVAWKNQSGMVTKNSHEALHVFIGEKNQLENELEFRTTQAFEIVGRKLIFYV
jgi:hypothetical protein